MRRFDWKAVMATAALALFASCGKQEPATPAGPAAQAPAQTGGELNLFAWCIDIAAYKSAEELFKVIKEKHPNNYRTRRPRAAS